MTIFYPPRNSALKYLGKMTSEGGVLRVFLLPLVFIGISLALASLVWGAPEWWNRAGFPVLDENQNQDHRAVVTVGQLKSMALRAKQAMDDEYASFGGAGDEITMLIEGWLAEAGSQEQRAAATVGQIKTVAKLFYDRLDEIGVRPLSEGYPWSDDIPLSENRSAATSGQLKTVFAFDLPPATIPHLEIVSGNYQTARSMEEFELPLLVKTDLEGTVKIRFNVVGSSALLRHPTDDAWSAEILVEAYKEDEMNEHQLAGVILQAPLAVQTFYVRARIENAEKYVQFACKVSPRLIAPTQVAASVQSNGAVELTWERSADDLGDGYFIERCELPPGYALPVKMPGTVKWSVISEILPAETLSYLDTKPLDGIMAPASAGYCYRLRSSETGMTSAPGTEAPVLWDTDMDGIPDWFERRIVNYALDDDIETVFDILPGDDFDSDGASNLEEWLAGTNPAQMHGEGINYELVIHSGNTQTGLPGELVALPLEVKARLAGNAGFPAQGEKIVFEMLDGGKIGAVQESLSSTAVTVVTDSEGNAGIYYQLPLIEELQATPTQSSFEVKATLMIANEIVASTTFVVKMPTMGVLIEKIAGDMETSRYGYVSGVWTNASIIPLKIRVRDPLTLLPLTGVSITFKLSFGKGSWVHQDEGSSSWHTVTTDSNGEALARFLPAQKSSYDFNYYDITLSAEYSHINKVRFLINPSFELPPVTKLDASIHPPGNDKFSNSQDVNENLRQRFRRLTFRAFQGEQPMNTSRVTFSIVSGEGGLVATDAVGKIDARSGVKSSLTESVDINGFSGIYFKHPLHDVKHPGHAPKTTRVAAQIEGRNEQLFLDMTTEASVDANLPVGIVLERRHVGVENLHWQPTSSVINVKSNDLLIANRELVVAYLVAYQNQEYEVASGWRKHASGTGWVKVTNPPNYPSGKRHLSYDHLTGSVLFGSNGITHDGQSGGAPSGNFSIYKVNVLTDSLEQGVIYGDLISPNLAGGFVSCEVNNLTAAAGSLFALAKFSQDSTVSPLRLLHRAISGQNIAWSVLETGQISRSQSSLAGYGGLFAIGTPARVEGGMSNLASTSVLRQDGSGNWGYPDHPYANWKGSGVGDDGCSDLALTSDYLALAGGTQPDIAAGRMAVSVYARAGDSWTHLQDIDLLNGYHIGHVKVAFDGDRLAVAAYAAHEYFETTPDHLSGGAIRPIPAGAAPEEVSLERLFVASYLPLGAEGRFVLEKVFMDEETIILSEPASIPLVGAGRYAMDLCAGDGMVAISFPKEPVGTASGRIHVFESRQEVSEDVEAGTPVTSFLVHELHAGAGAIGGEAPSVTLEIHGLDTENPRFVLEREGEGPVWWIKTAQDHAFDALATPREKIRVLCKTGGTQIINGKVFEIDVREEALEAPTHLQVSQVEGGYQLSFADNSERETEFQVKRIQMPGGAESNFSIPAAQSEVTWIDAAPVETGTRILEYAVRAVRSGSGLSRYSAYSMPARVWTGMVSPFVDSDLDGVPDDVEIAEGTAPNDADSNSAVRLGLTVRTPLNP